jgi:hypothetical protein
MAENNTNRSWGCLTPIYVIIQAVFIILKAAGVTNIATWSWGTVFIPTYIFGGILLIWLIICVILYLISDRY